MKVIEDTEDRYGGYPIIFEGAKNLEQIHEWLYQNYQGYKFVFMFDETKDEFEPIGKRIYVYFLDGIEKELNAYMGK